MLKIIITKILPQGSVACVGELGEFWQSLPFFWHAMLGFWQMTCCLKSFSKQS